MINVTGWCAGGKGGGDECSVNGGDGERLPIWIDDSATLCLATVRAIHVDSGVTPTLFVAPIHHNGGPTSWYS